MEQKLRTDQEIKQYFDEGTHPVDARCAWERWSALTDVAKDTLRGLPGYEIWETMFGTWPEKNSKR